MGLRKWASSFPAAGHIAARVLSHRTLAALVREQSGNRKTARDQGCSSKNRMAFRSSAKR